MNKWLEEILWIIMPSFAAVITVVVGYFILDFSAVLVFNVTIIVGFVIWVSIMINEFNKYHKGLIEIRKGLK